METGDTEETSTENAKISDSGYSNTCSNSQSHTSSGSSVSRNSNRSASSGYHGGNQSTVDTTCTEERLPKPITRRKGHKKNKSKGATSASATTLVPGTTTIATEHVSPLQAGSQTTLLQAAPAAAPQVTTCAASSQTTSILLSASAAEPMVVDKATEVAVVELVDATDPGVHNDNNLASGPEAGHASKASLIDEPSLQTTEEYYTVISLHDGLVLHTTPSLCMSLGYSKDLWSGKLFIDFLDPRDKNVFTERIADEIAVSRDFRLPGVNGRKDIFCRLRMMDGQYMPYRVNPVVQNFNGDKLSITQSQVMLLVVFFQPIRSAYKVPEERIISTVFTTRHTATCRLSYVDPDVVQYLGYLPQDMIDHSVFDFYYPEDLPIIKEIYETVINMDSSSTTRPKPYRYIVQNGGFVVLETEWSSFVNPWTKNLEFVVGQHRVLKGPADPNIFHSCGDKKGLLSSLSEEVLKQIKVTQSEIQSLLSEGVQRKLQTCAVAPDCNLLSKKKELTSFVETILQEIKSPAPIKDHLAVDDRSFSERDSVMLGEISPHHEYYDSKSSTETPPSYNQLNYHDNIERFFKSNLGASTNNKPFGSDEDNVNSSNNSSDETGKNKTSRPELKCTSSTNGSGNSGSGENLSSESNNQQSFGSRGETSNTTSNNSTNNGGLKPPLLTEILLSRHNEDMEKLMVQKHREQKKGDKRNKCSHNEQKNKVDQANPINKSGTRLKRSGSPTREEHVNIKVSKYDESAKVAPNASQLPSTTNTNFAPITTNIMDTTPNIVRPSNNNQYPQMSMPMPTTTTITHQCFSTPNTCSQAISRFPTTFPQMFPIYYLPMQQPRDNLPMTAISHDHSILPTNPVNQPAPFCYVPVPYMTTAMSSIMYPPIIGAPTPGPMMYRSFLIPEAVPTAAPVNVVPAQSTCPPATALLTTTTTTTNSFDPKRPVSRANSVKAEPGSTMAMSETSKKIFSPFGIVSSCVSHEGGCCSIADEYTTNTKEPVNLDDKVESSRNSSFFSSSLNKSYDSSSITDQRNTISSFDSKESRDTRSSSRKTFGLIRKEPPWIESVKLTPELIYQYEIPQKSLNDVLKADLDFLKHTKQPNLVNEQLGQLFLDLDLEGAGSKVLLEEPNSNNVSDSSSDGSQSPSRMGAW